MYTIDPTPLRIIAFTFPFMPWLRELNIGHEAMLFLLHEPRAIFFLSFELKSQVVLSCIEGSPAARAGIHQGDELVEINGNQYYWKNL